MTTAHLEKLTAIDNYILRVFEDGASFGEPYKFQTVVSISDGIAEIKGLSNANITNRDLRAMFRSIKAIGAHEVKWTHKGKEIKRQL